MKQLTILFSLIIFTSLSVKAQLNVYGGKNHDEFLGCIDCTTEDLNSDLLVMPNLYGMKEVSMAARRVTTLHFTTKQNILL